MVGQRAHVTVRGLVQGVGFRWFVVQRAHALGLTGWVRNRPDGAVEAEGEGERPALESWIGALREGPAAAHVTEVEVEWSDGERRYREFAATR